MEVESGKWKVKVEVQGRACDSRSSCPSLFAFMSGKVYFDPARKFAVHSHGLPRSSRNVPGIATDYLVPVGKSVSQSHRLHVGNAR